MVGKYNLEVLVEKKSFSAEVSEIRLHPDWIWHDEKYDADLAILILGESVEFSMYVQPVCLPSAASIDRLFDGFVVKWICFWIQQKLKVSFKGWLGDVRVH